MKILSILFLFNTIIGYSQNQVNVDIVTLKQLDNNIAMYIHTRPDSLANKGIKIKINVLESDYEIKSDKKYKNVFKKSVDSTKGDYDQFGLKTNDGIITTQISPITSKYYKLEVILLFPDGTKKVESKVLKIKNRV
ncbi:hypothetical protein GGR22_000712 [Flavobacterium gossypii]|uniref:DUF4625 domain-containing protein n=1 Tax=Flavobacterium gossypii TaxID=1646119 RepID=A0ABR6DLM5_9FLAO|nr:hypothetical protein [Flavobacterium gossypii]MBA9072586.1 hypothetical protein [Flavobacterium gossypii]